MSNHNVGRFPADPSHDVPTMHIWNWDQVRKNAQERRKYIQFVAQEVPPIFVPCLLLPFSPGGVGLISIFWAPKPHHLSISLPRQSFVRSSLNLYPIFLWSVWDDKILIDRDRFFFLSKKSGRRRLIPKNNNTTQNILYKGHTACFFL